MREWIKESFPNVLDNLDGKSEPGTPDVRVHCNKWWYYGGKKQKDISPELSQSIRLKSQMIDSEKNQRLSLVLSNIFETLNENDPSSSSKKRKANNNEETKEFDLFDPEARNNIHLSNPSNYLVTRENYVDDGPTVAEDMEKLRRKRVQQQHEQMKAHNEYNEDVMYFYMCPIIKKSNHRKHNSHQWFFDSICDGLEEKVTYAFLTDCGTSYEAPSLSYMLRELFVKDDLIGVTARQRIERPNRYFRPCEDSPFPCFRGDHSVNQEACWKCWATWSLSACPLQEFEASSIMSLAMFSMVECLPVMPGPCQMMNWQKMKEYHVVDEYFNLLFESENQHELPPLPPGLKLMSMNSKDFLLSHSADPEQQLNDTKGVRHSLTRKQKDVQSNKQTDLTFTEFLRVNMRLVEDRILSFVSVFSTGSGTKWVAGATFHYQPEILFSTLLTQRRRWINGTFCGYLFHFLSERARSRVRGGLLDASHKPGRNQTFIDSFFALQVVQLIMVVICPSIYALAGYLGTTQCAKIYPDTLGWLETPLLTSYIRPIECWVAFFYLVLAVWIIISYNAPRGKIPEWLCQLLIIYGFIYTIPVHFVIWYSIFVFGPGIVGSVVIVNVALPFVIALAESRESAFQYIAFMPNFIVTGVFFLVYLPQYSFARLWDTTWGNRATPKDSAINDSIEDFMKRQNVLVCIATFIINIFLFYAFLQIFGQGVNAIIGILFVMLAPTFAQMLISSVYIFLILPIQKCFVYWNHGGKPKNNKNNNNNKHSFTSLSTGSASIDLENSSNHGGNLDKKRSIDDLGIDYDDEGIFDVKSGTEFMDAIFPESSTNQGKEGLIRKEEMINALHTSTLDHKSFWISPGSNEAMNIELQAIIQEDRPLSPFSASSSALSRTNSATSLLPSPPMATTRPTSLVKVNQSNGNNNTNNSSSGGGGGGDAVTSYDLPDLESATRHSANLSNINDARRSSKRLEVAGRYSKV